MSRGSGHTPAVWITALQRLPRRAGIQQDSRPRRALPPDPLLSRCWGRSKNASAWHRIQRARQMWKARRLRFIRWGKSKMDEIFWIKSNPPVRLAIVLRPPGGNELHDAMQRIKQAGIQNLVSMLEPQEAELLG